MAEAGPCLLQPGAHWLQLHKMSHLLPACPYSFCSPPAPHGFNANVTHGVESFPSGTLFIYLFIYEFHIGKDICKERTRVRVEGENSDTTQYLIFITSFTHTKISLLKIHTSPHPLTACLLVLTCVLTEWKGLKIKPICTGSWLSSPVSSFRCKAQTLANFSICS